MALQTTGALVMILGSLLVLVAAFMPISTVYAMGDAARRQQKIASSLTQWKVSQALFALGSIVAALGVAVIAFAVRDKPFAPILFVAAFELLVGAILWSNYVYQRAVDWQAFVDNTLPGRNFVVYTLLTFVSTSLIGIASFNMGLPAWIGWLLTVGPAILCVVYMLFKDMPPFVHYILMLIVGIAIARLI